LLLFANSSNKIQSLKIGHLQGFCIIELAISQSGPGRDFFPSRALAIVFPCDFPSREVAVGSRVFLTSRAAGSSCSPPLVAGAAATTRIRLVASAAAVPARWMRRFSVTMESFTSSAADGGDGVARDRDIWREESSVRAGDRETRAIGLLPSRARLGIYAKFALSFAKLPKMQTPNAKPLDTSFCDFWQITRIQSPNVKLLEMLKYALLEKETSALSLNFHLFMFMTL